MHIVGNRRALTGEVALALGQPEHQVTGTAVAGARAAQLRRQRGAREVAVQRLQVPAVEVQLTIDSAMTSQPAHWTSTEN